MFVLFVPYLNISFMARNLVHAHAPQYENRFKIPLFNPMQNANWSLTIH